MFFGMKGIKELLSRDRYFTLSIFVKNFLLEFIMD